MTLECCNRMVRELWRCPSVLDVLYQAISSAGIRTGSMVRIYPSKRKPYINAYYNTLISFINGYQSNNIEIDYTSLFFNGFGEQYEIPQSKTTDFSKDLRMCGYPDNYIEKTYFSPGIYPTIVDLNGLFGVGIDYGKKKILGKKNISGSIPYVWIRSADGTIYEDRSQIEGLLYWGENGSRSISGYEIKVNNSRTTRTFGLLDYTNDKTFSSPTSFFVPEDTLLYSPDDMKFKLKVDLPTTPQDFSALIFEMDGDNRTYTFENKIYYAMNNPRVSPTKTYSLGRLCNSGNMSLRVSKYNDVLTNEDHADSYIEICRSTEIKISDDVKTQVDSPVRAIPLKKGIRYYFYIVYENGCCDNKSDIAPTIFSTLVASVTERRIGWCSTERTRVV